MKKTLVKILKLDLFFWRNKKPEEVKAEVKTGGLPFEINPGATSSARHTQRIGRIKDALAKIERKGIDNPVRKKKLEIELETRVLALKANDLQKGAN